MSEGSPGDTDDTRISLSVTLLTFTSSQSMAFSNCTLRQCGTLLLYNALIFTSASKRKVYKDEKVCEINAFNLIGVLSNERLV